jgi:hypothetical protein
MRTRKLKLLNNKYIIIIYFFKFPYPLRCICVPQVEYHWSRYLYEYIEGDKDA